MDSRKPDAALFPNEWKNSAMPPGATDKVHQDWIRLNTLADHAERILGVDRSKGERAHVFHVHGSPGAMNFCAKNLTDTLLFPIGHPLEGRDRYTWVPQADGSKHGFLVPEANTEEKAVVHDAD